MTKKQTMDVVVIEKELVPIARRAMVLHITNAEEMKEATIVLSQLNQFNDRITEIKEQVTKPLNQALKAERARWKPIETENEGAISILRKKMSAYQTELVNKKREEEESIARRIKPGTGNLSIEKAAEKIEALGIVEKEVATAVGLVQFRETATLKILDINLIPREYMMVNEKLLLQDLKEGKVVGGAVVEMIQVPVNYR